jgi:thiamine-phosphate diphosphorylase / hydroxyethylthiazole kinase
VQRVLYQSVGQSGKQLDGVAVVSAIMSAEDPKSAAEGFRKIIAVPPPFVTSLPTSATDLAVYVPGIVQKVVTAHPIVHSMINFVVANFVANVAIAAYVPPPIHLLVLSLLTMMIEASRP